MQPRLAEDRLPLVLSEATRARQKSIQLEGAEYAGELSTQLMVHASALETLYRDLQRKVLAKEDATGAYASIFKDLEQKQMWFEKAEARLAQTLAAPLVEEEPPFFPSV